METTFNWLSGQVNNAEGIPVEFRDEVYKKVIRIYDRRMQNDEDVANGLSWVTSAIGNDLLDIDKEIKRVSRLKQRSLEKNENYLLALKILRDESRRYLRTINGEPVVSLSVFLGLKTEEELEAQAERHLTKVIRKENKSVIEAVHKAIKDAIPEICSRTADAVRGKKPGIDTHTS